MHNLSHKEKIHAEKTSSFSLEKYLFYIFWAIEGIAISIISVTIPQIVIKDSLNPALTATLISLTIVFGSLFASFKAISASKESAMQAVGIGSFARRFVIFLFFLIKCNTVISLGILLFAQAIQSHWSKYWIEITRKTSKNPPIEIAKLHCASYLSSVISIFTFKYLSHGIDIRIELLAILYTFISSFSALIFPAMLRLYQRKLNNTQTESESIDSFSLKSKNACNSTEYSKYKLILFYIIFNIGALGCSMALPAVSYAMSSSSLCFMQYWQYRQIGQLIAFVIFTFITSCRKVPSIAICMGLQTPLYLLISYNYYGKVSFPLCVIFFGASLTIGQLIWSCSSIVFAYKSEGSMPRTRINNKITFVRGLIGIAFGYYISHTYSHLSTLNICSILGIIASILSTVFLRTI